MTDTTNDAGSASLEDTTTSAQSACNDLVSTGFKKYGTTIYDDRRKIIKEAIFEGFKIKRYEQMADGTYACTFFDPSWVFKYKDQLYYFLLSHGGQILDFFKLNMSPDRCVKGLCGVYFQVC